MSRVQATGTVDSPLKEIFHFSDWCYNDPIWASSIKKASVTKLPNPDGTGMVSHYVGNILGRDLEWDGESIQWNLDESWTRRATTGLPARMNMQVKLKFRSLGPGKTEVTSSIEYHVPYPLVGWLVDRFFARRRVQEMADNAINGLKKVGAERKIPPLDEQLAKRKSDHPGYSSILPWPSP